MKSLYNKVFKNYQVNVGIPFQIKHPMQIQTVKDILLDEQIMETGEDDQESPDDLLKRAREEAELMIKEAQYEAERIISNAEIEINEIKAAVEEDAKQRGYEEGFNEGKRQYEDLISEAETVLEQAKLEYRDVMAGIESDAVNMIMEIAKKVIGAELGLNREGILHMIKQAFDKCTNKENAVLKLSIDDFNYVSDNKEKLLSMVEGLGELEIKKDASMKDGDCIIETPFGSINAGIETKLEKIEEGFLEVIGK